MKIYALNSEAELYKPENALKWLNIPYTTITDMDNIPNCPNDIIIASPKQFADPDANWDEEQIETAMKILSPKFKKVIMFNDDYTGNSGIAEGFPFKSNNVYMLGLEKRVYTNYKGKRYRRLLKTNWNFNYVHCRTYFDYLTQTNPIRTKKEIR